MCGRRIGLGCANVTLGCLDVTLGCVDVTVGCMDVTWVCLDITLGGVDVTWCCLGGIVEHSLALLEGSLDSWDPWIRGRLARMFPSLNKPAVGPY